MSFYVIGLTGGIACGKTNLTDALRSIGVPVVDADEVSRAVTAKGGAALPAIRKAFGDKVFDGEALNRQALAALIFADDEKRALLNAITHPIILSECKRMLDAIPGPAVYSVPLLFECGLEKECNEVWCAYIPQKEQIRRLRERDGITHKKALEKIRSQMPTLQKARLSQRIIRTDGSKEESAALVISLWQETMQRIQP
ncbi:MAG: dephospho-CoA kinase [Clostridia bacterium]|nr:dephospho-CoA kinase [Clostridia bacterium]MBR6753842.1 dephospho-CoA kinase [Clostridia bacterium]